MFRFLRCFLMSAKYGSCSSLNFLLSSKINQPKLTFVRIHLILFLLVLLSCVNQGSETTSKKDSTFVPPTPTNDSDTINTSDEIRKEDRGTNDLLLSQKFKFEDKEVILNHYNESVRGRNFDSYSIITLSANDTIDYKIYKRIEALGGLATVLVPVLQPSKDYFILAKFGDYDGNVLLIDPIGMIRTIKGGNFFITDDHRYLISPYNSDCAGLSVFDLKEDSLIYDKNCENDAAFGESSFYDHWYKDKNQNYYWLGNYGDTDPEGFYWIYQFSFEDRKLKLEKVRKDFLDKLDDVHWVELKNK